MKNIRRPNPTISVDEIKRHRLVSEITLDLAIIQEAETGEPFTPEMMSKDADARAIYDGSWFKDPRMGLYTNTNACSGTNNG